MLRKFVPIVAAALLTVAPLTASDAELDTDEKKALYALGVALSQGLGNLEFSADDAALVQSGFGDGLLGKQSKVEMETYGPRLEEFLSSRIAVALEREQQRGQAFRDSAASAPGAVRTESGLIYVEQQAGTGAAPSESSTVTVNYQGSFTDGEVFDSSRESGEPATFALSGVFPCFAEGIRTMRVGGKTKLICPPDLAYGDRGIPPLIPPGATLVFELELLDVSETPAAAPATP